MELPRHWRLKAQRYRLEGVTCPTCGQFIFPPRPVCPQCAAPLDQVTRGILTVNPGSLHTAEIESRMRYEMTETNNWVN